MCQLAKLVARVFEVIDFTMAELNMLNSTTNACMYICHTLTEIIH